MFTKIAWATDGSELADSTLPIVTELAGIHDTKLIAIHVNGLLRGGKFGGGPVLADEEERAQKIRGQVDDLRAAGFEVELELVSTDRSDTAGIIAELALNAGADLIVVGTHGRSAAAGLLTPSIASGLIRHAHCAVLAQPPLERIRVPDRLPLLAAAAV